MDLRLVKFLLVAVSTFVGGRSWADSTNSLSAETAFKEAAGLMQKGSYKEALPLLKHAETEYPTNSSLLWNLGIAYAAVFQHQEALQVWQRYEKVEPADWRARAKVIQAHQALGDFKSRDVEIQELYLLRKQGKDPSLSGEKRFCREQFEVEGHKVFAFEYFDQADPKKIFFRFSIVNADGKEESYISLGSYKDTVSIARDLGEIKQSEELYHLDKYQAGSHWTYAFYKARPGYDAVREKAVKIIRGDLMPVSASERK